MPLFKPAGDKAVLIEFEQIISEEISARIRNITASLEKSKNPAITEIIPAYASICVIYDPCMTDYDAFTEFLSSFLIKSSDNDITSATVFEIPVLYNDETGSDLSFVSEHCGLLADEIISIHTSVEYLIYMLGFAPGFPYLGGMDERIAAPRLKIPRKKIAPGSVGIAGSQTGMYPIESPGGWQIIGQTPIKLYDPNRNPAVYYSAGDYIKYRAIDSAEFDHIQELVRRCAYEVRSWEKSR